MSIGWVHVIAGPMFSGKTQELIRLITRHEIAGRKVGLFRPEVDTRTNQVLSRAGLSHDAIVIKRGIHEDELSIQGLDYDVVAIDEAQFFSPHLNTMVKFLATEFKTVIISGLEKDFLRRPFGPMADLLVEADEVTKLTAICTVCKKDATLTQRLINGRPASPDDPLILVGGIGDDTYEARCRAHHQIGVLSVAF